MLMIQGSILPELTTEISESRIFGNGFICSLFVLSTTDGHLWTLIRKQRREVFIDEKSTLGRTISSEHLVQQTLEAACLLSVPISG
jgi:hypothetical protein